MPMPKPNPAAIERFASCVPSAPGVTVRPMFGHRAAFVHGSMFAGTFGLDIVVRVDDASRAALFAQGATPFEPMKGRAMKEFAMLPREWAGDPAKARHWIGVAFEWTSKRPKKVEPTKKPSRTPAPPKARARKRR